ncbi:MAG: TSUP family transporter, partial [Pirellula sp.]
MPLDAILPLLLGSVIGLSLGLTGGGGAIFAVPLLIYGLGFSAKDAIGVSLVTVAVTACFGFVQRARVHQVEFSTGIVFGAAGIAGAPLGSLIASQLSEVVLMASFSLLMFLLAVKMWTVSITNEHRPPESIEESGVVCSRLADGKLCITSPCALLLGSIGFGAGVLAGMF